jgi:hypothetical protein
MGEAVLVNRKKLITSLANELVEPFDKAVEDLLKKYEKRMAE